MFASKKLSDPLEGIRVPSPPIWIPLSCNLPKPPRSTVQRALRQKLRRAALVGASGEAVAHRRVAHVVSDSPGDLLILIFCFAVDTLGCSSGS